MNLSFIAPIEQLTSRVIRILGCNPGQFTLQGTNTYLIGTGKKRILIDSGEPKNEEYTANITKVLNGNSIIIDQLVITHWHSDHLGGAETICKKFLNDSPKIVSKIKRKSKDDSFFENFSYNFIEDGHKFETEGATLKAIFTPGHTDDHMALLLEEENAIFSGDCVLGEGSCVFEDLSTYMKSLNILQQIKPNVIYPGHGAIIKNPVKHVQGYIDNRNNREKQIIEVLGDEKLRSALDIVKQIYMDINEALYPAAENNVKLHLKKLLDEARVELMRENEEDFWKIKKLSKY